MKSYIKTLSARLPAFRKKYWDVLPSSERRAVILGAWVILPVLFFFLIWQPQHVAVKSLRGSVPKLKVQAERMRVQMAEADALRHQKQPAMLDGAAVKGAVEILLARHGLREALISLEVQPPNGARVVFSVVSFQQWVALLRDLQSEQQIRIESIGVVALPQNGMVKLSATFVNGSPQ